MKIVTRPRLSILVAALGISLAACSSSSSGHVTHQPPVRNYITAANSASAPQVAINVIHDLNTLKAKRPRLDL
jgi:hypothetical protein